MKFTAAFFYIGLAEAIYRFYIGIAEAIYRFYRGRAQAVYRHSIAAYIPIQQGIAEQLIYLYSKA